MNEPFRGPNISFSWNASLGLISVVIPVYRDHAGLATTLASLNRQTLPRLFWQVVVANDGGAPEVTRVCEDLGVECLDLHPNGGSYFARNRGLERVRGEFIAFVDADIEVSPQWLQVGLEALQTSDYVAGPVRINRQMVKSYAHQFERVNAFPVEDYLKNRHFGPTANLFVRRAVFEAIGGFDERLRSGGDLEFGDRLFRDSRDWRQSFCERLEVIHPPRNLAELKIKYLRVAQGHASLARLHSDRFSWMKTSSFYQLARLLVPPNPLSLWTKFGSSLQFPFPIMYLFCWRMRILKFRQRWAIKMGKYET